MKERLLIIDGNSLLYRAYYAMPALTAPDGTPTNAVYGFLNMYFKLLSEYRPDYTVIALDVNAPTFRHDFYSDYKGTRQPAPDDLITQMGLFRTLISEMGICLLEKAGYEADDILGTVAGICDEKGIECFIITADRDSLQLITENTNVILTKTSGAETKLVRMNLEEMEKQYGMTPLQFVDLKALTGDTSDNIPGVKGIGEVTAKKLISDYGSLEGIYEHIEEIKGKQKEKLLDGRNSAFDSRFLAAITREVPIEFDIEKAKCVPFKAESKETFRRLGFKSIIETKAEYFEEERNASASDGNAHKSVIVDNEENMKNCIADLVCADKISLLLDKDIKLCNGTDEYVISIKENFLSDGFELDTAVNALKPLFEAEKPRKIVHGQKNLLYALDSMGSELNGIETDTELAEYLIDAVTNEYSLKRLAAKYLNKYDGQPDAYDLYRIAGVVEEELKNQELDKLFYEVELPLTRVLYKMEKQGFAVDKQVLSEAGYELDKKIMALANEIYEYAGEQFNINSPKQLGHILFERLGLPYGKKTKSGYSTDVETLARLSGKHPIIEKIIEYRQAAKLKSTYVDGLMSSVGKDGKIHTKFMQTITSTGRLSSIEPNLQNIPVRTEEGKQLRKAFIPSGEKRILIDADYSQIELRVMAHVSMDPSMIEAFRNREDIHASTAAKVFGVPKELVSNQMRSDAKAVNFGIIYGISDFGLSKNIDIGIKEANEFIELYFKNYPSVKEYMNTSITDAKANGYVKTMFGRKRMMKELSSRNYNERSFGERVAINMPIQGSAADIIKIAMLRIDRELEQRGLDAKMILQVHDEIIIDAPLNEKETVEQLLKECMENVITLKVPLEVDISSGTNWYNCK